MLCVSCVCYVCVSMQAAERGGMYLKTRSESRGFSIQGNGLITPDVVIV